MKKAALGRGLGALIDGTNQNTGTVMVDIRKIEPNPNQPRQHFDEESLAQLADSIKTFGIVQPLLVKSQDDHYTIIAGERRFRAARIAKLNEVPVIIKDLSDRDILQISLIENIQRDDLTPIEEAQCYRRLIDEFLFTTDTLSEKLGKTKHRIVSLMNLLELGVTAKSLVASGDISLSHARLLLSIENEELQTQIAEKIAKEGLSVRAAETLILYTLKQAVPKKQSIPEKKPASDEIVRAFKNAEINLARSLGSKVNIKPGKKKGRIEIEYSSPEELDRLIYVLERAAPREELYE